MPVTPESMTAIVIRAPGEPEVLVAETRPVPRPEGREILIRVAAAGVNRPDVAQRRGHYLPPPGAPQDVPGLEIAGEVVAAGPAASRHRPGDDVTALVPGGGYAEYAIADEGSALPVPAGLDMVHAAAIPETYFTVWSNVFERGGLQPGETLLVHGGSSGIGTTAIQLGKAFGARVVATAGSEEKCEACRRLGADVAINYREADFVDVVGAATEGRGADVILDMVGGSYVTRNYRAAAVDGRIVQIAFLEGARVEADLNLLMRKRLVHTGSTLRPREASFKAAIARALEAKVWPLLAAGTVSPVIDRVFPLREAAAAHRHIEGGEHVGKIVLEVS